MNNQFRFIECCDMAIRKGFGNYFVMPNLTWKELKSGLENGQKLTPEAEKEIQKAVELLSVEMKNKLKVLEK